MDPEVLNARLTDARRAWLDVMQDFKIGPGMVQLPPATALEPRHVENCKVVAQREQILRAMPRDGRAAEVGVLAGRFSQKILDICRPTELHLFDTNFER